MPLTMSPDDSSQRASGRRWVASSLNTAAAACASQVNFEERLAATFSTRLGLYRGGTSADGLTCIPLSRAPVRVARSTANCTLRRPAWPPSTCTSKSRNMFSLRIVRHSAWDGTSAKSPVHSSLKIARSALGRVALDQFNPVIDNDGGIESSSALDLINGRLVGAALVHGDLLRSIVGLHRFFQEAHGCGLVALSS